MGWFLTQTQNSCESGWSCHRRSPRGRRFPMGVIRIATITDSSIIPIIPQYSKQPNTCVSLQLRELLQQLPFTFTSLFN